MSSLSEKERGTLTPPDSNGLTKKDSNDLAESKPRGKSLGAKSSNSKSHELGAKSSKSLQRRAKKSVKIDLSKKSDGEIEELEIDDAPSLVCCNCMSARTGTRYAGLICIFMHFLDACFFIFVTMVVSSGHEEPLFEINLKPNSKHIKKEVRNGKVVFVYPGWIQIFVLVKLIYTILMLVWDVILIVHSMKGPLSGRWAGISWLVFHLVLWGLNISSMFIIMPLVADIIYGAFLLVSLWFVVIVITFIVTNVPEKPDHVQSSSQNQVAPLITIYNTTSAPLVRPHHAHGPGYNPYAQEPKPIAAKKLPPNDPYAQHPFYKGQRGPGRGSPVGGWIPFYGFVPESDKESAEHQKVSSEKKPKSHNQNPDLAETQPEESKPSKSKSKRAEKKLEKKPSL